MKVFYDTEFVDDGRTIELGSIGMVREDGAEYYAETDYDPAKRVPRTEWSPWMLENVVPHLSGGSCRKPRGQIADEIRPVLVGDRILRTDGRNRRGPALVARTPVQRHLSRPAKAGSIICQA